MQNTLEGNCDCRSTEGIKETSHQRKKSKMSMSGISVHQSVGTVFNEVKLRHVHKYVLFKIENKKEVVIDQAGEKHETSTEEEDKPFFEEMRGKLTNEPRYILYDFGFTNKDGRKINKLAFIFWCDDNAKIGDKMLYASTKDKIKKTFTGLSVEFQANDSGDLDYDAFKAEVEKKA